MENLEYQIKSYMSNLSREKCAKTIYQHGKKLSLFQQFLEEQCQMNASQIYLDKLYAYYDINNRLVKYDPIDSLIIESFFLKFQEKSQSWLSTAKSVLNCFFTYLNKENNLQSPLTNLSINFCQSDKKANIKRSYSRHEVIRFINAIITSNEDSFIRDLVLYSTWLLTGCRPSEIISIKVCNILFDENKILLTNTKNKKERVLLLPEMLSKDLHAYCEREKLDNDDFLFMSEKNKALTLYDLKLLTKYYFAKANCVYINLYAFRHTYATLLYENETKLSIIQQALGHSSVYTTKEYIDPNYVRNLGVVNKQNVKLYNKISTSICNFLKKYKRSSGESIS